MSQSERIFVRLCEPTNFVHLYETTGQVVSMCKSCLFRVCRTGSADELSAAEAVHVCEPELQPPQTMTLGPRLVVPRSARTRTRQEQETPNEHFRNRERRRERAS